MLTTEIIRDTTAFRALESEWTDLLRSCAEDCLFLSWEWMYTWWRHLSGNRQLHLILVRCNGRLVAIAPLALRHPQPVRLMPFRALEFLGSGSVGSDYLSFLIRQGYEDDALREIAHCLAKSRHMLELVRVDKTSVSMCNTTRHMRQLGWYAASSTTARCPGVTLSGLSWESYLCSLDRGHRKRLTRNLRKLNKDFAVELKTVATDEERQSALGLLIRMHLARWSKRGGSTAFNKSELIDFHQAFSRISLERGWLRLYTLLLNDVVAAAVYLFHYNRVAYYYQVGFDDNYKKYSVGTIILALAIQNAIADGAVEFDFLHGDEAYKYLWARKSRELVRLEYYPPKALGRVQHQIRLAKSGVKHLLGGVASRRITSR